MLRLQHVRRVLTLLVKIHLTHAYIYTRTYSLQTALAWAYRLAA